MGWTGVLRPGVRVGKEEAQVGRGREHRKPSDTWQAGERGRILPVGRGALFLDKVPGLS